MHTDTVKAHERTSELKLNYVDLIDDPINWLRNLLFISP